MEQRNFWSLNLKYLRSRKMLLRGRLQPGCVISTARWLTYERGIVRDPTLNDLLDISLHYGIGVEALLTKEIRLEPNAARSQSLHLNGAVVRNIVVAANVAHSTRRLRSSNVKRKRAAVMIPSGTQQLQQGSFIH